jgi:predicted dithiol-disulfide oxidoreductase (DUF899 family)
MTPPAPLHQMHLPNEPGLNRTARNALLQQEVELRKRLEDVATLRRSLPLGGEIPEDYVFSK